ncbi:tail fiber domain-containing protein [uncultured Microscilla sp.]|uniref:tail fiber domain-containing protein n=1 Tax=uncultured Microscilla sp. TaxID=432653 RepID=UPI0026245473|nr:tail fiber domain-containing protein [uncultured Microscilla sp.]
MKKHNSILVTLSLMAFFALGMGNISQAQNSRLSIKKPGSGIGVTLDNEAGGNTIFSIGGSEKMRLTSDGKLGIGTANPQTTLQVSDENADLRLQGGAFTMQWTNPATNWVPYIEWRTKAGIRQAYIGWQPNYFALTLENGFNFGIMGGRVGIGITNPSYALDVAGYVQANNVNVPSDIRYKKNIQTLSADMVAKLSQVRGTSYGLRTEEFKEKRFLKTKQVGIIAQELLKVYPELVVKGADGYYSVNYMGLIPILVEAVKDLRKNNDGLNEYAQKLKDKNKKIKETLTDLKSQHKTLKTELNDLKSRLKAIEKSLEKSKD